MAVEGTKTVRHTEKDDGQITAEDIVAMQEGVGMAPSIFDQETPVYQPPTGDPAADPGYIAVDLTSGSGSIMLRNLEYVNECFFIPDRDTGQYTGEKQMFQDGSLLMTDTENNRWTANFILRAAPYVYEEPKEGPEFGPFLDTGFKTRVQAGYERFAQLYAMNR